MNATGVIVEYNPFHNGHLHHIKQSRLNTGSDIIIAVMSGHFLQRGEPALLDKWQRAEMALKNGADLVIELPYVYATGFSEEFAFGGVTLLEALNCQFISFGSEDGQIDRFKATYDVLNKYENEIQLIIKESVKSGVSYPNALNNAYRQIAAKYDVDLLDLTQPNNILGFHYFEQIKKHHYALEPTTVQRIGAGYHDAINPEKTIASATGIRQALFKTGNIEELATFMPASSYALLKEAKSYSHWASFYPFLRFTILRMTPQDLAAYVDITEGIEFLIYKAAKQQSDFEGFMQQIKSKRYTWTRIQRMLTHLLLGYKKELKATFTQPEYIRVLGMTENGQKYLSYHKKNLQLPLISKVGKQTNAMLDLDIRATDLYMLASAANETGLDYKTPPIRLK